MLCFFTMAVILTGGLYSVAGSARFGTDMLDTLTVISLVLSLLWVLLILARIFWVTSRHTVQTEPSRTNERM